MKKVDLHIHTIATISDSDFIFDINAIDNYIKACSINAIAITNHNMFNLDQYMQIKESTSILVFPGIEINLEKGHLLLISDFQDISDFNSKCLEVNSKIAKAEDSISVRELMSIFGNLDRYLLIPHYDKSPTISESALLELKPYITAGEVNSPKKFMYCIKDQDSLVPVYFSDCRMTQQVSEFPVRQTFINCGDISFNAIKNSFRDKRKVFLSPSEGRKTFQIFNNGQELSTGLNVIIGERSTGKSYTLERISGIYPDVKYIRQFSLVERDEEQDKAKFDKILSQNHSFFTQEYLKDYLQVVSDITFVDNENNQKEVIAYIESLKKHAQESERQDAFSKSRLFREEQYNIKDNKGLTDLINSVQHLIENIEYRDIIIKHVSINALRNLIVELIKEYNRKEEERLKKIFINELIVDVKKKLQLRTAATTIKDVDLYKVSLDIIKREKFITITKNLRRERIVMQKNVQGFQIVAKVCKFSAVADLKSLSKSRASFKQAYQSYDDPYEYLKCLKSIGEVPETEYYKYFGKIEYKILNRDGYDVSGGERSEFNLLQEIDDAQKYEMLLIDEPESSFDNIFLKNEVNKLIKEISLNMPVVLVTHNNTVGASIMPDYILCTKKEVNGGNIEYSIYSGFSADRELRSMNGKTIKNIDVTLSCLEAGKVAYDERRKMYEDLKD